MRISWADGIEDWRCDAPVGQGRRLTSVWEKGNEKGEESSTPGVLIAEGERGGNGEPAHQ
jgi:hypothetical protein